MSFLIDKEGRVVSEYVYDVWGNLVSSSGSISQPYQYLSYYSEVDIGLYLVGRRWYDSKVGRYISRNSPYTFKNNNPVGAIQIQPIEETKFKNKFSISEVHILGSFSNMGWYHGVEGGFIIGVGRGTTYWCDSSCNRHKIEWWKWCVGFYGGVSWGSGYTTVSSETPNTGEISIPFGPYPGGIDIGFPEEDISGGWSVGVSVGYLGGIRRCQYNIILDEIIGKCRK